MRTNNASKIKINNEFHALTKYLSEIYENQDSQIGSFNLENCFPKDFIDCTNLAPKTINDLNDGVSFQAYRINKNDKDRLAILGFFNINLEKAEKIIVVEYLQTGSIVCKKKRLKYGVGARLLMKVETSKWGAKLNTPQQITASVIFGKAYVEYCIKTLGITGPFIKSIIGTGTLNDDTFTGFIKDVSSIVSEAYRNHPSIIINPQPLPYL